MFLMRNLLKLPPSLPNHYHYQDDEYSFTGIEISATSPQRTHVACPQFKNWLHICLYMPFKPCFLYKACIYTKKLQYTYKFIYAYFGIEIILALR